jgi:ADP-heptose:LPS heptosyltransferase
MLKTPKHILVVRLSALGDVAMTVPVIRALLKEYPELKITFVSKPFLKPLFNDIKNVNFYAAEVNGKHKGFLGIYNLFVELSKLKIDAVADVHNVLRSKILRFFFHLTFTKVRFIDKGRKEKKAITRSTNKIFKQLKTTHERYADVFKKLGFNFEISNPDFPEKQNLSSELVKITGEKTEKWIGIAPFAQYKTKMYPLHLMEQVIDQLAKLTNVKILLFGGGKKEVEILSDFENKYPNTINIAGKIKLKQELALISNLDVMLSMDSGNAHFAAMLGIPTVTIWGNTHPFIGFAPFNQPIENAIIPDLKKYPLLPTSVYGNKIIEGYEDVTESISPQRIFNKVSTFIN